ncbi:MAG TPA: hypothetical protein VEF04_02620, partial [Blastocatellia bacterium]|nr:hypothetical protein [Blastocatellia bacterium]
GLVAIVLMAQGRRMRWHFGKSRRRRKRERMPRVSKDLLAGFQPLQEPHISEEPEHVWRWNRETKQFSITLLLPEHFKHAPHQMPYSITEGLLVWKMFTYVREGREVYRNESTHEQTINEFLTFGPTWHAPTQILLEVLSYLGLNVPIWFDAIYLRECLEDEERDCEVEFDEDLVFSVRN